MMWNWQLSALACGAEIVVFDGPLGGPETLWQLVAGERVKRSAPARPTSAFARTAGTRPREEFSLEALRTVMSTGSILHDDQYKWLRDHVGPIQVQSISGGTDIVGCFVLGNPNLPVYPGEAQCRSLGLDVQSLPFAGSSAGSVAGDLICRNPFPSRPLGLYGDRDGTRFHDAYFAQNPGVWTHGDLIEITEEGSCRLHGRSDGVLNVGGVRIGPAEIYTVLLGIPEIKDAMVVEQQPTDRHLPSRIVLLIILREAGRLDDKFRSHIREALVSAHGPTHAPALILEVEDLPRTHSNKPSERAARDAVNGVEVENIEALRNPECLEEIQRALALQGHTPSLGNVKRTAEPAPWAPAT